MSLPHYRPAAGQVLARASAQAVISATLYGVNQLVWVVRRNTQSGVGDQPTLGSYFITLGCAQVLKLG